MLNYTWHLLLSYGLYVLRMEALDQRVGLQMLTHRKVLVQRVVLGAVTHGTKGVTQGGGDVMAGNLDLN